ncbi:MAG: glutathione S-transferase [Sinobacteraceae bacterium]|nr:glutathione S-transferase [Nevskiaceae bacterium]
MPVTLYYNPQSRAQLARWLLEELGIPYTIAPVEYDDGSMRTPEFLAISPLGKIPAIVDDGKSVSEQVAVALYLADRYKSPNDLAPAIDHSQRGDYLRWMVFTANVEAAMTQKFADFQMNPRQAGWGSYDLVVDVLKKRIAQADPWLLGARFTAVDVVLGGGLNYAVKFGDFPALPEFTPYLERLTTRPAFARAAVAGG